ncbi:CsbD family protein [uncultured Nevskia sp.]|uniref:CsbD family protein n=1 Tax=uncultured Nevskia sp. TaxID=228950 RepID=UPI0025DE36CF|nr:CsbD family protein [uncultured Nevskia sp.]
MSTNKTANAAKDVVDDAASSAAADKAKGHTKEVVGSIKAKVGSLIGDKELEAKGHAQNAEGKTDRLKGEIKETIEDVKDKVKAGVEVVKEKFTGSAKK